MSATVTLRVPDDLMQRLRQRAKIGGTTVSDVIRQHLDVLPADGAAEMPAWTGTGASARKLADLIAQVDEYAEVETENAPGSYFRGKRLLHLDAVPNRITLEPGDRPVFDGERWTVDETGRVQS